MKLSDIDLNNIDDEFAQLREQCPNLDIIKDGVLDKCLYEKTPTRVLWILKQDYYDSGCLDTDYAIRIKACISNGCNCGPSWRKMSYVSYMLQHNVCWKSISKVPLEALLATAIIEVDKSPSETTHSPDSTILQGFARFKSLIFKQIDVYSPHVVIFCGGNGLFSIFSEMSMHYAGHPYDPESSCHIHEGDTVFFTTRNCSFIWAYHPSYAGICDEEYCEGIMKAYQMTRENIHCKKGELQD